MNKTLKHFLEQLGLRYEPKNDGYVIDLNEKKVFISSDLLESGDELETKQVILSMIRE